jgi:hypothetical protein
MVSRQVGNGRFVSRLLMQSIAGFGIHLRDTEADKVYSERIWLEIVLIRYLRRLKRSIGFCLYWISV